MGQHVVVLVMGQHVVVLKCYGSTCIVEPEEFSPSSLVEGVIVWGPPLWVIY